MLYLAPSMFLMKASLMNPLMVPMMAFLWSHKWKLYLDYLMVLMKAKMLELRWVLQIYHLMVPIMDFLWVHNWKLQLAYFMVLMKANLRGLLLDCLQG